MSEASAAGAVGWRIEPAAADPGQASAFAHLHDASTGHGLLGLYGPHHPTLFAALFLSDDATWSHTRTSLACADASADSAGDDGGEILGHVTCVPHAEWVLRERASARCVRERLGLAVVRTRVREGLRVLRGNTLGPWRAGQLHIASLAVASHARRRGIGRALIERAVCLASEQGHSELSLDVAVDNHAAIGLYERAGFRVVKRQNGNLKLSRAVAAERTGSARSARAQVAARGFVAEALPLADRSVVPALIADARVFDDAVERFARERRNRVPYLLSEAITRAAHDATIVGLVEDALQTDRWVMWGSNIRRDTPNQAHRWHLDLESFLWRSLTVAVGLQGCSEDSATWFIPGAHRIERGPREAEADGGDAAVLRAARAEDDRCGEPERVRGFADAKFFAFDARCWHRGDARASAGRTVLFLHYQRADEERIPTMLDYQRGHWSREACPFLTSPTALDANPRVARPPLRHRAAVWLERARQRRT